MTQPPKDRTPLPQPPEPGRTLARRIADAWATGCGSAGGSGPGDGCGYGPDWQHPPTVRFAPSPTGHLHLGHAYSALLNAATAQMTGGTYLTRIEDIDAVRCRPAHIAALHDDLRWLQVPATSPIWQQSQRPSHYRTALATLWRQGVLYPCRLSRSQLRTWAVSTHGSLEAAPRDPDGALAYRRDAQANTASGALPPVDGQTALRLDVRAAQTAIGQAAALNAVTCQPMTCAALTGTTFVRTDLNPASWGDPVVARKDIGTSYHLSVVVDDAAQGVTLVIRGCELAPACAIQVLLQRLLGLPSPAFAHHGLITAPGGEKLSKRRQDRSLQDYRDEGYTLAVIKQRLGFS